jgi:hypothetical protein
MRPPNGDLTLENLADRALIIDTLAWFCSRLDLGDLSGAVRVFIESCTTDYGPRSGGPLKGRTAFLNRIVASTAQFRRAHHQLGQVLIHLAGDTASTVAYVMATHRLEDGTPHETLLQYHDEWIRTPDGWRITDRRTFTAVSDGGDPEARNWVPRSFPPR